MHSPLYYVRGGLSDLSTGSLRSASRYGLYWSATTYPNTMYAYALYFYSASITPSHFHNRFLGFSVRFCPMECEKDSSKPEPFKR